MTRKRYSAEFKREAVAMARSPGVKINKDIHSLHDSAFPINTVIDRHLSRVMEPVICQLSILVIGNSTSPATG